MSRCDLPSPKSKHTYFGELMLSMFESVAVDPYSHHGSQLTMVGRH